MLGQGCSVAFADDQVIEYPYVYQSEGILQALGAIDDPAVDLEGALAVLDDRGRLFAPESLIDQNPAKQLASQLVGRVPIVIGAGSLVPAARRWKTQFNENSKKLGKDKGTSKYLYELFPYGPAKQACKYAGLPKPTGCV